MRITDLLKNDMNILRSRKGLEKIHFVWDYYRWQILIGVLIICLLVSSISNGLRKKEVVLTGVILNSHYMGIEESFSDINRTFLESQQIDPAKYELEFIRNHSYYQDDNNEALTENYETVQILNAYIASHMLDYVVGEENSMTKLCYLDFFCDLSAIFTPEQLKSLEPRLLYMDRAVIDILDEAGIEGDVNSFALLPDCRKPETMDDPVPILIDISDSKFIEDIYPGTNLPIVIGFAVNSQNTEICSEWIEFILDDNA